MAIKTWTLRVMSPKSDESEAYLHDPYVGDVEVNCTEEDMDIKSHTCEPMRVTPRMKARTKK
jgi:hypothetical protein